MQFFLLSFQELEKDRFQKLTQEEKEKKKQHFLTFSRYTPSVGGLTVKKWSPPETTGHCKNFFLETCKSDGVFLKPDGNTDQKPKNVEQR